jgi:hypothetical protein
MHLQHRHNRLGSHGQSAKHRVVSMQPLHLVRCLRLWGDEVRRHGRHNPTTQPLAKHSLRSVGMIGEIFVSAICGDSLEAATNGRVPVDASLMLLGT